MSCFVQQLTFIEEERNLKKKIIIKKTHTETFAKLESFLFLNELLKLVHN